MLGKWPLGRFLDGTKMGGVADTLESSTVIQKDFSKLERWAEEMLQHGQMNSPGHGTGGLVILEKRRLLGRRHRKEESNNSQRCVVKDLPVAV